MKLKPSVTHRYKFNTIVNPLYKMGTSVEHPYNLTATVTDREPIVVHTITGSGGVYGAGSATDSITSPVLPYPTLGNGLLWLNRKANVFSDLAGSVPASLGDGVASWQSVGGSWGTSLATQSDSNARPNLMSSGVQPDGNDDYFDIETLHLAGPYTVYFVASGKPIYPSAESIVILGTQVSYPFFFLDIVAFSGETDFRISNYVNAYTNIAGLADSYLFRIRRLADNTYSVAGTGLPEIDGIASGSFADGWTYDFTTFGKSFAATRAPGGGLYWKQLVVVSGDTVTDGTDGAIRAKLVELEGLDL